MSDEDDFQPKLGWRHALDPQCVEQRKRNGAVGLDVAALPQFRQPRNRYLDRIPLLNGVDGGARRRGRRQRAEPRNAKRPAPEARTAPLAPSPKAYVRRGVFHKVRPAAPLSSAAAVARLRYDGRRGPAGEPAHSLRTYIPARSR